MNDTTDTVPLPPLRLAVGAARLTMSPWAPDRRQAIATLHAALDAGVRMIDTADCYSDGVATAGANEALVAEALRRWPGDADEVLVGTKGGRWRPGDGTWRPDGRPTALRAACEASLRALGTERIGLYHLHAVDPQVRLEESLGALADLCAEGKIERIGVSNLDVGQLARARATANIAGLQNALSVDDLQHLELAAACGAEAFPFFAWAPLRGARLDEEASAALSVAAVATDRTVRQVALAWLRSLTPTVVPIIGPITPAEVAEAVSAPETLPVEELRALPRPGLRRRAAAVALRDDDHILLVRQEAGGRRFWTLPGGGVDPGEADDEAAVRELREETGITATVSAWLCDLPGPAFLVDVGPDAEPRLDPHRPAHDDVIDVAWRALGDPDVAGDWQVRVVLAALGRPLRTSRDADALPAPRR